MNFQISKINIYIKEWWVGEKIVSKVKMNHFGWTFRKFPGPLSFELFIFPFLLYHPGWSVRSSGRRGWGGLQRDLPGIQVLGLQPSWRSQGPGEAMRGPGSAGRKPRCWEAGVQSTPTGCVLTCQLRDWAGREHALCPGARSQALEQGPPSYASSLCPPPRTEPLSHEGFHDKQDLVSMGEK